MNKEEEVEQYVLPEKKVEEKVIEDEEGFWKEEKRETEFLTIELLKRKGAMNLEILEFIKIHTFEDTGKKRAILRARTRKNGKNEYLISISQRNANEIKEQLKVMKGFSEDEARDFQNWIGLKIIATPVTTGKFDFIKYVLAP